MSGELDEPKITVAELHEMFGPTMPMEAFELVANPVPGRSIADVRKMLREAADRLASRPPGDGEVERLRGRIGEIICMTLDVEDTDPGIDSATEELVKLLSPATPIPAELAETVEREADEQAREVQSVWRCAIGDVAAALDVLKNHWLNSRRKHEREAGQVLGGVADLIWAARDPAARNYEEANENGKAMIARARETLTRGGEGK
jgi:hypothetical protein